VTAGREGEKRAELCGDVENMVGQRNLRLGEDILVTCSVVYKVRREILVKRITEVRGGAGFFLRGCGE